VIVENDSKTKYLINAKNSTNSTKTRTKKPYKSLNLIFNVFAGKIKIRSFKIKPA
jgi:hypothetical protein